MLTEPVKDALNEQINAELSSEYLYLSMAAYFEDEGLAGFASWMREQANEEHAHAMRIYDYIIDRDGRVELDAIDKPRSSWDGPTEAFQAAYDHEVEISGMIDELVRIAREENDNATENMLEWFVAEQVEEEATAQDILDKLKLAGDSGPGLMMLDQELGERQGGGEGGAEEPDTELPA